MMGTDPFLWIGDPDPDPGLFPDPDPPFVTRSFADTDPIFLTRSRSRSGSGNNKSPIINRDPAFRCIGI